MTKRIAEYATLGLTDKVRARRLTLMRYRLRSFVSKLVFAVLLCMIFLAESAVGQSPADPFVGTWSVVPGEEKELFHIQKVDNKYIITFYGRYSLDLERLNQGLDWWTATVSGAELIGDNKSRLLPVSKNEIVIADFSFQGEERHSLHRIQAFSEYFGIWQSDAKDASWIKLFKGCDVSSGVPCRDAARCFTVLRNRNKPGETPYAITSACAGAGLSGDGITIQVVTNDKIKVNWSDEGLQNRSFSRAGPKFVGDPLIVDSGAAFVGRWSEDGSTEGEVFTVRKTNSGYHIESSALFDGVKTEWQARLLNGQLLGRPKDDGTGRDTGMRVVDGVLLITNLYGNDKRLRRVRSH